MAKTSVEKEAGRAGFSETWPGCESASLASWSVCTLSPPLSQPLTPDQHTQVLLKSFASDSSAPREKEQTVVPRSAQSPDLGRRTE